MEEQEKRTDEYSMKLSIIVPVYRVETTLERCILSIVCQTFSDFEVILVDDGSPDDCPRICDEWAERDYRIKVVHKQNGGLSDARNVGIEIAQGEWITFVDSDDYLEKDTYAKTIPLTDNCDILEFPLYWHYGSKRQKVITFRDCLYTEMSDYWLKARAYEHTYAWNKIYRRDLFRDIRFPKGKVFEDVATLPKLLSKAPRVKTTGQGLYYYCMNDKGITATAGAEELAMLLDSHLSVLNKWCDDRYYLHVLNIQMDVYELKGQMPRLPFRKINVWSDQLSATLRMKAFVLNLTGIRSICKINSFIHKIQRKHS